MQFIELTRISTAAGPLISANRAKIAVKPFPEAIPPDSFVFFRLLSGLNGIMAADRSPRYSFVMINKSVACDRSLAKSFPDIFYHQFYRLTEEKYAFTYFIMAGTGCEIDLFHQITPAYEFEEYAVQAAPDCFHEVYTRRNKRKSLLLFQFLVNNFNQPKKSMIMKKEMISILLLGGLVVSSACAQENKERPKRNPEELFKKLDTDGDGKISKEEAGKTEHKMIKEHFSEIDSNSDGLITKEEFLAFKPKRGSGGAPPKRD